MTNWQTKYAIVLALCVFWAAPVWADQTDPELDTLFSELRDASNPAEINRLENRILDVWRETKSDSIDLLMNRAIVALAEKEFDTALLHFNDVVELAPDYAEGWNRRATLLFVLERYSESIVDIERTVALEPRHFGAWSGLGKIFLELGNNTNALRAYRQALAANPHLTEISDLVKKLEKEAEGRGI